MYAENTSDAWHIPRCPTRKHCTTSMYCTFIVLYYVNLNGTVIGLSQFGPPLIYKFVLNILGQTVHLNQRSD